jgi:hypothetical protein
VQVLVQLVLLDTLDGDLADRLEATWAEDPAAADEAVGLLLDDPRVIAAPTLLAPAGEVASLERAPDNDVPSISLVALPTDEGVAVDLEVARAVEGNLLHYRFDVYASDGRFTAVDLGDLTVLLRPVIAPDAVDLEQVDVLEVDGREPDLRPRARRRAIDALLVD